MNRRHPFAAPAALLLLLLATAGPAHAQRDAKVPDPDPEIERQALEVADGYEVSLFAADPMLAKPIQMNFDAQGRLWVASSEVYPQIKPGQTANDKILVLEDADGDGKAEKTTVFADGLLIPTGVEPGDGGAYVANSTEVLFLKDTDGDGKADQRKVVLAGFGTEDTHHIIHTFRWGNDGQLYFNQSIYIHSHVETPWGPRRLGGGGTWMYRPETGRLEVLAKGLVNPWGHEIDRWGQHFGTDGAGGEGINYLVPGASYFTAPGAARIVAGLNPGSPKHCGLEILSGRHLPDDMQGVLVTHDFRANRVARFKLSDDGSGYSSRELPELIKTRFPAFRPIDVKQGPDGAIYVADWFNPIIQHGEVDFRDPRRDHTHGRIWRITAKNRPLVPRPKLVGAPVNELLDHLKAPEGWTRHFAKRVLKERGAKEVLPALSDWVAKLNPKDPEFEHQRLEGLWMFQALDVPQPALLAAVLASPDARARAAAVRVIPFWADRLSAGAPLDLLGQAVVDENPRVRLEAVRALSQFPDPRSLGLVLKALDRPLDRWLDYGLWLACRELQPAWLPALQAGTLELPDTPKLTYALQAAGSAEVVGPLLEAVAGGRIAADRLADVLRVVGAFGTPDQVAQAASLALNEANGASRAPALRSLADASAPRNLALPATPALTAALTAALKASVAPAAVADPLRLAALRAAAAWRLEPLREAVRDRAAATAEPEPLRLASIETLAALGGAPAAEALDTLAQSDGSATVRRAAVIGLASIDTKAAAKRAVALLGKAQAGDDVGPVFAAFIGRQDGPAALAAAFADQSLPRDTAKLGLRLARAAGRPDQALIDAITKAGGLDAPAAPPSPAEVEAIVAEVVAKGDPVRGEAVFRRAELQCRNCHAIAGAGSIVGPGLESIGASAPVDYLVDSLMQPNKAVKEGYHSVVVATNDGRLLTGIVVLRTDKALTLRDADGRETTVTKEAIDEEKPGPSLMPEGLTESLTREEFRDLVRFLSELGKPGRYAVGARRLVRRWEALPGTKEMAVSLRRIGHDSAAGGGQPFDAPPLAWAPVYSQVAGTLPLAELPPVPDLEGSPARRWLRFSLDVTQPGPIALKPDSADGLTVWVDGRRVEPAALATLDLAAGRHTIAIAVDPKRPGADLAVELLDVPGSPARAQLVVR